MKKLITVGTKVKFDTEHGLQRGTVADIKQDISNAQSIAIVDVPGTQSGAPWKMPLNDLQLDRAAA